MQSYFRRDEWAQDHMGNAISGVNVWICSQPANTNVIPPSPLVIVYADAKGSSVLQQPLQTDQDGHVAYYAPPGIYTVIYSGSHIVQVNLLDQIIAAPTAPGVNRDLWSLGQILGPINGSNTQFQLSASPLPPQSLVLSVNGIVQLGWDVTGSIVTLAYPPQYDDDIEARYTYQSQE